MFGNDITVDIIADTNKAYHPGQTIEGQVVCVFKTNKNVRGINLKLYGKEHTAWRKSGRNNNSSSRNSARTEFYSGDNTFLERLEKFVGEGTQNAGTYEFPFKFLLPKNLPSSYQSANGNIKYSLKATVDVSMSFDATAEKKLHVISLIDLNEVPISLFPANLQGEKTICCWWCAGGNISMNVHMEREAFIIGEDIKLKIEVTNMSNAAIEGLKVEVLHLIQETARYPRSDSKNSEVVLASKSETGVEAHASRMYNTSICVPSYMGLMNFEICTLFRQETILKVEAVIPGFHQNLRVTNVIKLGHVLPESLDRSAPANTSDDQPANSNWRNLPESTLVHEYTPSLSVPNYGSTN